MLTFYDDEKIQLYYRVLWKRGLDWIISSFAMVFDRSMLIAQVLMWGTNYIRFKNDREL